MRVDNPQINTLVIVPTYNECEQIAQLAHLILRQQSNLHLLIIDDNSPDGTGQIADNLAQQYERMQVVHRPRRLGYASAFKLGLEYALRHAYPYVLTMSADFRHNPRYINSLVALAHENDVAIGSRFVPRGGSVGTNVMQSWCSRFGNNIARRLLALQPRDCTSYFRCYRTSILPCIHYESVRADNPVFMLELLERIARRGFHIQELPVVFDYRLWPGVSNRHWGIRLGFAYVRLCVQRIVQSHREPAIPETSSTGQVGR